ncbi:MAG: glycosyltransferase family 2 protein [Acidobacteriota bacterium]
MASPLDTRGPETVALSVVIPVRNDPTNLEHCLSALAASEDCVYEVIVVDDASTTDETAAVARRHGVKLLRQEPHAGPAAARNLGAGSARYDYLFFLDADVCVQPTTLKQIATKFAESPDLNAFFGSYDASPGAPGLLSQYRNLLHHYVHQSGNEDAFSFWSGCGAVKKSVFLDLGGFDIGYASASVEDIELGARLRDAGHRIELDKSIQVKHMKRWTLWGMIHTDIKNRAIPWTLLLLRQGDIPNDLNLRHSQRLSAVLAGGLVVALSQLWLLAAAACMAGIVACNLGFYRFLVRAKNPLFALVVIPLHALYYLYSSLAFAWGLATHFWRRMTGSG